MSRYIDAELFDKNLAMQVYFADNEDFTKAFARGMELVKKAEEETPTADVEEVRHGKWICRGHNGQMEYAFECSVCERWMFTDFPPKYIIKEYPYCHCGVKMDSVEKLEDEE